MFFRKKEESISRTQPGFEETERKTPKTGIILLILMFIAGGYFGWIALDDLSRVPDLPPALSYCSGRYLTNESLYRRQPAVYSPLSESKDLEKFFYYSYDTSQDCQFNDLEDEYGIPALINKRKPIEKSLMDLSRSFNDANGQLENIKSQRQNLERQYGIGLEEIQAGVPSKIFPITPEIQQQIKNSLTQEKEQQNVLSQYKNQLIGFENQLKEIDKELEEAYKPVFRDHNRRLRVYEFNVFLLQLAFALPLFLIVFFQYLKLLRKNSPYAIIFTAMTAVSGILLLRVMLFWFWGLFLAKILETVLRWMRDSQFIKTIVFYSGMIFSFLIFGGGVYYLQKKVFDPRRVALRRFRAKQCPRCQTNLDLSVFYCPNCGYQLKEKCEKCGQARFVNLPACPYCGTKK